MKSKRLLVILFTLVALIAIFCTSTASAQNAFDISYVTDSGTKIDAHEEFSFSKSITEFPLMFEATVKFPADYEGYGGIILSSLPEKGRASTIRYDIQNGNPCVRVYPTNQHTDFKFTDVNVYTGEWVNIKIVFDTENEKVHCYVDGVLAQSKNLTLNAGSVPYTLKQRTVTFGNDEFTADNAARFMGAMKKLALYSDSNGETPICSYDLLDADNADIIPDLTGNGYYITRKGDIVGGTELTGTVPSGGNFYKVNKTGFKSFATVELMLCGDEDDYGVVYSNYQSSSNASKGTNLVQLEITSRGYLKLSHWGPNACASGSQKITQDVTFSSLNVLDGKWRSLAIVRDDANDEYRLYVNGALAETVKKDIPDEIANMTLTQATYFGRNNRTGTYDHFTGKLMSFATFSDVRSVEEICRDIVSVSDSDDSLIAYYDFRFAEGSGTIPDKSGNGADLKNGGLPKGITGNGYSPNTSQKEKPVMSVLPAKTPKTVEFTVMFPKDYEYSTSDGRVISNRPASDDSRGYNGIYDVYIYNGYPCIYLRTPNEKNTSIGFSEVILPKGEWVNVAITVDTENKILSCYVNGELRQTANSSNDTDFALNPSLPVTLGWNNTSSTGNAFKGAIKSVALYSDVRSAEEVCSDRYYPEMDGSLIAYYDAEFYGYREHIRDMSYNENDLINNLGDQVSYADETLGATFDDKEIYQIDKMLDKTPLTLEAVIKYPEAGNGKKNGAANAIKRQTADNDNVIFGNYFKYTVANVLNFEINKDNHPTVYVIDSVGYDYTFIFDEVFVNDEVWNHVAITFDAQAGYAYCYVNGTLRQQLAYSGELDGIKWNANEFAHIIGGDQRTVNSGYFNSLIRSLTLYSDVRDAKEIYSDASAGVKISDENIICHYDLSSGISAELIEDATGKGYDMVHQNQWIDAKERDPDSYAYSMAIIGDTQWMTYLYPDILTNMYDWIKANAESKKISYVMGLGDINQHDTDEQWAITSELLASLAEAGIPQSIVCGGTHDSVAQYAKWIDTDYYLEAYSDIMEMGFWDDPTNGPTLTNSYSIITIGQTKYMFLTLEYAPKADQVEWANGVIASHPDCNVIISTHTYLFVDGTHHSTWDNSSCDKTGTSARYCGDELWDALVRKHENIVMVLSGHVAGNDIVKSEVYGDNGNKIVEILVNPQVLDDQMAGVGMVAMLYFSEDGKQVDLEYYSTKRDQLYREGSQFSFEIDSVSDKASSITNAAVSLGSSINVNYYAHIKGDFNRVQMKFTVNGVVTFVDGEKVDDLNKYHFTYKGIAPQMMGDLIDAELIIDGVSVDTAESFSVESYAKKLLDASAYELTLAPLHDDAFARAESLYRVLRALLGYGSSAQMYKDYKTDSLVGADINDSFDASEIQSVKAVTAPVGDSGVKFKSATVRFDSVNYLRFDFVIGNADINEISLTIGNKSYTAEDFVMLEDGIYSVYSEGIYAVEFNKAFTASLILDGRVVHTATYSVNSYIKSMYESQSMGSLVKAIYLYGKAADEFRSLQN